VHLAGFQAMPWKTCRCPGDGQWPCLLFSFSWKDTSESIVTQPCCHVMLDGSLNPAEASTYDLFVRFCVDCEIMQKCLDVPFSHSVQLPTWHWLWATSGFLELRSSEHLLQAEAGGRGSSGLCTHGLCGGCRPFVSPESPCGLLRAVHSQRCPGGDQGRHRQSWLVLSLIHLSL
jgi:hypothetical protein